MLLQHCTHPGQCMVAITAMSTCVGAWRTLQEHWFTDHASLSQQMCCLCICERLRIARLRQIAWQAVAACVHNRYLLVTLKLCLLSVDWPGNLVANPTTHHVEQTQIVLKHILGGLLYMAYAMMPLSCRNKAGSRCAERRQGWRQLLSPYCCSGTVFILENNLAKSKVMSHNTAILGAWQA